MRKNKKIAKMLTSSALVAAIVVPSFAPSVSAAEPNWRDQIQNLPFNVQQPVTVQDAVYRPDRDGTPKVVPLGNIGNRINNPLVQSITPALGSTVVRPDQSVEVQLNTDSLAYKFVSRFADRFLGGYVLDGKTVTPIDKSQIKFDEATGKVTVQPQLMARYTTHAIVLGFSPDGINRPFWQDTSDSIDVVTAVDTDANTITTLNHGTIPVDNGRLPSSILGMRIGTTHDVGDVISVVSNKYTKKVNVIPRKDMGASTIFTTGSDLNEPTKVSIPTVDAVPSVLGNNDIVVSATDDYGLPANAPVTVTIAEQGSRLPNSATLISNPAELTDGMAKVVLENHEAEPVHVSVSVNGQHGSKTAETQLQYQPGPTEKLTLSPKDKYVVGQPDVLQGKAHDIYDNTVKDGTTITATSSRGLVQDSSTLEGNFELGYNPSTQKGTDNLVVTAGDSKKSDPIELYNRADKPAQVLAKTAKVKAGVASKVEFEVKDTYGNLVENDEDMTLTFDGGVLPAQTVQTKDGSASFDVTAPAKGAIGYKVDAKNGGFQFVPQAPLTVGAGNPAVVNPKVTEIDAGEPSKLVFEVKDGFGNLVDDGEPITLSFTGNTLPDVTAITVGGTASFDVNIPSEGDVGYNLSAGNGGFNYVPASPLKVKSKGNFDIDVKKDMIVKDDGSFAFKAGTWSYSGDRKQTPLTADGEIHHYATGSMGGYGHPLSKTTATIELDAKTLKNDGFSGMNNFLSIRTGYTGAVFSLYPNKIELYDDVFSAPKFTMPIDGTVYHNYRLVKDVNKATIYVDGKQVAQINLVSGSGYGQYAFYFGDGTSYGGAQADAYYKSVKIAEGQALYIKQ
jgi:hypothetical protein